MQKLFKKAISILMIICLMVANGSACFAAFKGSGKRAVIIIPGIGGSELFSAEDQVVDGTRYAKNHRFWPPECLMPFVDMLDFNETSLKEKFDINAAIKDLSLIACNSDGTSRVKMMPANPILDCKKNPKKRNFGVIDFYKKLVTDVCKNVTDSNCDVIFFSYDFRRSNKDTAAELERLITENNYESVDLIGHSMGCLVCSSFLANKQNQSKTDKIILIGGPLLGAPKAYSVLDEGRFVDGVPGILTSPLIAPIIKNLVRNFPSVYELLPPKQYFDVEPNGYLINGVDYSKPTEIKNYEETVEFINKRAITKNSNDFLYNAQIFYDGLFKDGCFVLEDSKLKVCNILGIHQNTPGSIVVNKKTRLDPWTNKEIKKDGDGMVTIESALVGKALNEKDNYYLKNVSHMGLIFNKASLALVRSILNDNFKVPDKYNKVVSKSRP